MVTKASSSLRKAQDTEQEIISAMEEVEKLSEMVTEAKGKADEARQSARDVLMKTNRTKQRVDESNEDLRTLIKQIRDFLTRRSLTSSWSVLASDRSGSGEKDAHWFLPEEAADLESVEMVANEVLAMQMPTTPAQLQNLTNEIRQKVAELGDVEAILQQSANDIQRAEKLLDHARRAK